MHAPGCRAAQQTPAERVLPALKHNFQQQQYYITGAFCILLAARLVCAWKLIRGDCAGKLDPDIFAPNCRFKDPTTDVSSVKQYGTAVSTLFDPAQSKAGGAWPQEVCSSHTTCEPHTKVAVDGRWT